MNREIKEKEIKKNEIYREIDRHIEKETYRETKEEIIII